MDQGVIGRALLASTIAILRGSFGAPGISFQRFTGRQEAGFGSQRPTQFGTRFQRWGQMDRELHANAGRHHILLGRAR
jgi:hypothetical protein